VLAGDSDLYASFLEKFPGYDVCIIAITKRTKIFDPFLLYRRTFNTNLFGLEMIRCIFSIVLRKINQLHFTLALMHGLLAHIG